ncbi:hypothetical protein NIES4071_47040 [Calothrix sp. NIES-4071]|nr:hypothetical protein NIES4071_47040 [Calothrix sp. NIES-4071]BAZ59015.1 hypothetical protein NIES4105_46970 [Calothrix sp. NIES-4105]
MKLPSKLLTFFLIFSLVSSPVLAVQNKSIYTVSTSDVEPGMKQAKQQGILQRFGFKRNRTSKLPSQGFFSKFNLRRQTQPKQKVQQKQKRQGFLSRFRLRSNSSQKPKNQKRGFLRLGIGKT